MSVNENNTGNKTYEKPVVKNELPKFVKIKLLIDGAIIPTKQHQWDAAFDVFTPSEVNIKKGRNVIPLGFALEMSSKYAAFIRSRSGFSLRGMEGIDGKRYDANVITGLIDSCYRGNVGVIIQSNENFTIAEKTRIAQLQFIEVPIVEFQESDELTNTERGNGGYGSTNR